MAFDVAKIEDKIDRAEAGAVTISSKVGGVSFQSMIEVMEFAKLMATADLAVPAHLRGNPGACLAICIQATEWNMSPFAVANKSYIANDRLAFESQLIHSIIEARAPIKSRLRYEIIGEGNERRCKVWATFKGEDKPHEFTSETLATMHPGYTTKTVNGAQLKFVKGSPLWDTKPEVQMFYNASRDWARLFCPDVILGIYAPEELPDDEPKEINPKEGLKERLTKNKPKGKQRGFDADHIETTANTVIDQANGKPKKEDDGQLDIAIEAARKAGTEAGPGAPTPEDLRQPGREAELEAWIDGNHSLMQTGEADATDRQ